MALPLKTGADLYNQQLIRARLQNLGAQPNTADVGLGQVYFNTGTNTAASLRIGYCYETGSVPKFHHVANLEDVNRLEELISALSGSSSESVASVLGRVITLEGYFSNGKAKDADLLDGHNSDYFAEAATLNDLLDDYEAFKAVFSDNSDDYINTWSEVKAFLDGIKNTEDLNAILLGINTELGKKADKATTLAGYGITDAVLKQDYINLNDLATVHAQVMGYGNPDDGWKTYSSGILSKVHDSGFALQGRTNTLFFRGIADSVWEDKWHVILHDGNYASELDTRYLKLTGGKISGGDAPLSINSNSLEVGLHFTHKDESKAYVGWRSAHGAYIYNSTSKSYLGISDDGTPQYNLYELLHLNNYSDLITDLNKNLNVPSITIGGIKLSVVEGQLQIEGDAFATGQLSSGGIGSEGSGSGASGIVILEDWEKYDDTLAQVLGAGLGIGLRDKIAALESKATNVSVAQTLTSGKEIGAITIDGVATKLFAPNDYISTSGGTLTGDLYFQDSFIRLDMGKTGRSRISNIYGDEEVNALAFTLTGLYLKSPSLVYVDTTGTNYDLLHAGNYSNYALPLSGGTISGALSIQSGDDGKLIFDNTDTETYWSLIYFKQNGETYGRFGTQGTTDLSWNSNLILHSGNYESIVGNKFLKLSGGELTGSSSYILTINRTTGKPLINYRFNGTSLGFLGIDTDSSPCYVDPVKYETNTLLHTGNFNSYALPITGGTLTGNLQIGSNDNTAYNCLILVRSGKALRINCHATAATIDYGSYSNSTFTSEHALSLSNYGLQYKVSGTINNVIHSGNFNNYAPTLTGTGASGTWGIDISGSAAKAKILEYSATIEDSDALDGFLGGNAAKFAIFKNITSLGFQSNDGIVMALPWTNAQDGVQVAFDERHVAPKMFMRAKSSNTWGEWKKFAFTDSDITGNAASATKLADDTAFTAWGQTFFVNGKPKNVSGNIILGKANIYGPTIEDNLLDFSDGANLFLGYGVRASGTTYIYGKKIIVRGSNNQDFLTCNSSGNVTIGGGDLASVNHRLYVSGGLTRINSGLQVKGHTSFFAEANDAYVTSFYTHEGGLTIQPRTEDVGYTDIFLNPSGGNVGIGTTSSVYKLNVNGSIGLAGQIISQYEGTDAWRIVATSSTQVYIQGGVGGNIAITGMNATELGEISLYAKTVAPQYGNSTVLGAYNRRWLNVISEMGNFSSRLLVGGASDDGTTALQVNGDIHVTGNIIADGQVSSGGVAEAGTGGATGGSGLDRVPFTIPANTTSFTCEHNLGTREISVSIYEDGNDFQQVLADVYLDSDNTARIVFGSATDVAHKVVIIG